MKKYLILTLLFVSISVISFAKKDIDAWKNEKSLSQQYEVFKNNLNFWNGSYFMKEPQLEQFYGAISDSIAALKKVVSDKESQIVTLNTELNSLQKQLESTQAELNKSERNQNSLVVFGATILKSRYNFIMFSIVIGLLLVSGILFLMFKRSNKITSRLKKEYNELKEEYEVHKKNALERYTQINLELHHTRLKLNKKIAFNEKI